MTLLFGWCLDNHHRSCPGRVREWVCPCRCHCRKCGGAGEVEVRPFTSASPDDRRVRCECVDG